MIIYGWTREHINEAIDYVNYIYGDKGVPIEARNVVIKSNKCQRGNQTIQFTLGFSEGSALRKNEKMHRAGVGLILHRGFRYVKDIIPPIDFGDESDIYVNGAREYMVDNYISTGHLCWHAYGYFMAKLFMINLNGKIVTGVASYEGIKEFKNVSLGYSEAEFSRTKIKIYDICNCEQSNLDNFKKDLE